MLSLAFRAAIGTFTFIGMAVAVGEQLPFVAISTRIIVTAC
jgi:hypothetical protein